MANNKDPEKRVISLGYALIAKTKKIFKDRTTTVTVLLKKRKKHFLLFSAIGGHFFAEKGNDFEFRASIITISSRYAAKFCRETYFRGQKVSLILPVMCLR